MSLPEAIMELVQDMEHEAKESPSYSGDTAERLRCYAKQLRRLLKASENTNRHSAPSDGVILSRRKQEEKLVEAITEDQERGPRVAQIIGDPSSDIPTSITIPAEMPIGAKTCIGCSIYQLRDDGNLYYSEEDTRNYLAGRSL